MFELKFWYNYFNLFFKGAITGLVSGVGMCLFIAIGTIVNPRPKAFQLSVSVDGCPAQTLSSISHEAWVSAANRKYYVNYEPE